MTVLAKNLPHVTYAAAGAGLDILLLEKEEPPARPPDRAAIASSGENAPATRTAATSEAIATGTRDSSSGLKAWHTTGRLMQRGAFSNEGRAMSEEEDIDMAIEK